MYRFSLAFVRHWYTSAPPATLEDGMAKLQRQGFADGVLPTPKHAPAEDEWSVDAVLSSFGFGPAKASSVGAMLGRRTTAPVRRRLGSTSRLERETSARSAQSSGSFGLRESVASVTDAGAFVADAFRYQYVRQGQCCGAFRPPRACWHGEIGQPHPVFVAHFATSKGTGRRRPWLTSGSNRPSPSTHTVGPP